MASANMKPTNADAQRILAVTQELKERLTFMSVITDEVWEAIEAEDGDQGATTALETLGPDLTKMIDEQIR